MKPLTRTQIILALALAGGPALADMPEPFTARYEVRVAGLGGELTSTLSRNGAGVYVFENRTRAKGVARMARPRDVLDRSEFRNDGDRLQPLRYDSEDGSRKNKRGNVIEFDWNAGKAGSQYKGELRPIELEEGILDRQLLQIAMMRDLAAGERSATYTVIDRHDVKRYEVEVLGEEKVAVPGGEFQTLKVERRRPGSSRSSLLWCAPELDYLPVRLEQLKDGEVIATLQLTDIG